ncbi:MAG: bifunctional folylpolyglutamate synthase/dihydrofolate synthase [Terriglobia bacterium]
MDYIQALEYLNSRIVFGIRPGLERIQALCARIGSPQAAGPVIQITGSNGKSSVASAVSALLRESGFRVGTYTSPHLHSYTERIQIDGQPVSEEDFAAELDVIVPHVDYVDRASEDPLTHFEIVTALAYAMFSKAQVDVAVVEVGLGGRFDATSIVSPRVAVVTNVELEHTDLLGETIVEIAREKTAIVKEGSGAVFGSLKPEASLIASARCLEVGASSVSLGPDFGTVSGRSAGSAVSVRGVYGTYEELGLQVAGAHQADNFAVAVAAAEKFLGRALDGRAANRAAGKFLMPGRLEQVARNPSVILDGAAVLAKSLEDYSWDRLLLVVGIFGDKEIPGFLEQLVPLAARVVVTENENERRAPAAQVADEMRGFGVPWIVEPDLAKAIDAAVGEANAHDLVLITGSLYTVAEARGHLLSVINDDTRLEAPDEEKPGELEKFMG